jgi:hypothetical protein
MTLTTPLYLASIDYRSIANYFLLDPIDGTRTQTKHVPRSGLMICVIPNPIRIVEAHEIQCTTCFIVDPSVAHATPRCA